MAIQHVKCMCYRCWACVALLCSCGNQLQKILEFPHLLQQVGTPWGMFACCLHVFVCAMVTRWTCDERAMHLHCDPENLGFLGRAEALAARRFSGAVSAMRLKCRMRVQNYCKNLDKKKVKCTKSKKNAINVEKNQRSCIFTNISSCVLCQSSEQCERYKQCSNVLAFMSKRYKRYKRYTFLSLRHVCAYSII